MQARVGYDLKLKGKRALVTGASRGIGAAIASALAKEGASLFLNYTKSEERANSVANSIRQDTGAEVALLRADVSNKSEVDRMFATIRSHESGNLDILVNNAGLADPSIWNARFEEIDSKMWERVFSVDLLGTFLCTQGAAPMLRNSANGGRVINISSTPVLTGDDVGIVYSSIKAGVLTLTKNLARLLAPRINVNCMILGSVETDWVSWLSTEQIEVLKRAIPLHRFGFPAEVANVAVFFASDESSYVTGQGLVVDGGEVMR